MPDEETVVVSFETWDIHGLKAACVARVTKAEKEAIPAGVGLLLNAVPDELRDCIWYKSLEGTT